MSSSHTNTLNLPTCINNKIVGHVLPDLKSASLLFIGQFYDNGCSTYFNKNNVYIIHKNSIILQGHRKISNCMWIISVPIKPSTVIQKIQDHGNYVKTNTATSHKNSTNILTTIYTS